MHARIARWERADADTLDKTVAEIRQQGQAGPPPGVPAKEFLMLVDRANGRALAITLFDTEEDMREGDKTLSSMNPPGGGMGLRTSVEMYEVGAHFTA